MIATEGTAIRGTYLFYSCYSAASRVQEQFVHDHALTFILDGSLDFYLGTRHVTYHPGDIVLVRRNQLAKATKIPPAGGAFRSVSLHLYQDLLRKFSIEDGLQASGPWQGESILSLTPDAFSKSFLDSITPYMSLDEGACDNALIQL